MPGEGASARSQELIFLDPDDDLGTVRAKLESSPAEDVFLVVPRRAATLRTPLEYRILARLADELSTDVTVVSADAGRRQLAHQEGLRTRRVHRCPPPGRGRRCSQRSAAAAARMGATPFGLQSGGAGGPGGAGGGAGIRRAPNHAGHRYPGLRNLSE